MKYSIFILLLCVLGCSNEKKEVADTSKDERMIENLILQFHKELKQAYTGKPKNTDSLYADLFQPDVYYVTYWGNTEPIDSTKLRVRKAIPLIKDYEYRLEGLQVKVFGEGAYAFFILRQTYTLNGNIMDEYLPTTYILERKENGWKVVHSQRSADFQTIQHLMEIAKQREIQK
jgi:hypothetical protein